MFATVKPWSTTSQTVYQPSVIWLKPDRIAVWRVIADMKCPFDEFKRHCNQ